MVTTKVEVNVTDSGSTEKVTKKVLALKDGLEGIATVSKKANAALNSAINAGMSKAAINAPTTSSRAVDTSRDSSVARSLGPGTGAEARDFAKQAQGLGGLVHIYATFAANLFAVSAAFMALSRAADTTNMIKGLDQLGAVSGRNLGSLSKQLVMVTDGAVSLREAMTATAQATSGGMSSANLLRMGMVAKQASQALGVAMPDALSRLSRGITKLEPELLDEIGILVRVDTASQNYARSIGKSASALSDFEKRQGFANAVLEQGEKKFGAIKLDANPYSKILASIQNITQSGLELINKVLSPILSLLSSSPTALATAMGAIALVLLKQALPAIGMFKENMQAAADQAKNIAIARSIEAQKGYKAAAVAESNALVEQSKKNFQASKDAAERIADEKVAAVVRSEATIAELREKAGKKSVAKSILSKSEFNTEDVTALNKAAASLDGKLSKAIILGTDDKKVAALTKSVAEYKNYATAIEGHLNQEVAYNKAIAQAELDKLNSEKAIVASETARTKAMLERRSLLQTDRQTQIIADRAMIASAGQTIVSQAAQTGAVRGFTAAWKEARAAVVKAQSGSSTVMMDLGKKEFNDAGVMVSKLEEVTTPRLNKIQGGWISIKAGISGATSALATGLNFLGPWMAAFGLVIAALVAFNSWLSNSGKELDNFSKSSDSLNSSLENNARTLEVINNKSNKDLMTVESIQAKATALDEMSGSLKNVVTSFEKLQLAQNGWDSFWDGLKDLVGKGSADILSKNVSLSLVDAFKLMEEGPAKQQFKTSIETILKQPIDVVSFPIINNLLKDLDKLDVLSRSKAFQKLIDGVSTSSSIAASNLTSFRDSLAEVEKQLTLVTNGLIPTDEFSKLGVSLVASSNIMSKAFSDPITQLTALGKLAENNKVLSLLPPDLALKLGSAKNKIIETSNAIVRAKEEQVKANEALIKAEKALNVQTTLTTAQAGLARPAVRVSNLKYDPVSPVKDLQKASQNVVEAKYLSDLKNAGVKSLVESAKTLTDTFTDIEQELFKAGLKNLQLGLTKAMGEASVTVTKGYVSLLAAAGANTTSIDASAQRKSIELQISDIKNRVSNTQALITLTLGLERKYLQDEKTELSYTKYEMKKMDSNADTGIINDKLSKLEDQIKSNQLKIDANKGGDKGILALNKLGTTNVDSVTRDAIAGMASATNEIFGKQAALVKLFAELKMVNVTEGFKKISEEEKPKIDANKRDQDKISDDINSLSKIKEISGEYNKILETENDILNLNKISYEYAGKLLLINKAIRENKYIISKASGDDKDAIIEEAQEQIRELNKQETASTISKNKAIDASKLGASTKNTVGQASLELAEKTRFDKLIGYANEIAKINIDNETSKLELLKEIGAIEESVYLKGKAKLDLDSQTLEYAKSLKLIADKRLETLSAIKVKEDSLAVGENKFKDSIQSKLDTDKSAAELEYIYAKEAIDKLNDSKTTSITLNEKLKSFSAKQTEDMAKMVSTTESLSSIFGELGTAIGKTGEALLKFTQDQELFRRAKEELVKSEKDSPERQKKLSVLNEKSTKAELSGIAAIASSSSKLFAQQSTAAKLLVGIEKAANAVKIVMAVEKFALDMGLIQGKSLAETWASAKAIAGTVTESGAIVAASIPAIMAQFLKTMGPFGWAAGALAIAAIGGSLSGSDPTSVAGFSSEEKQKVQGTGQSYDSNGNLVNNGGGALGDVGAKSKAIENILGLIEANTFSQLSFSNGKTYDALISIRDNTLVFAKALGGTTGITGGLSAFGTEERDSSGFLGFNKNSTQVKDTGIVIAGALKDLIDGGGTKKQYENVQTSSSSFWGLFSSTSNNTNEKKLKSSVDNTVTNIFKSFKDTLVSLADSVGSNAQTVSSMLDSFNVNISASGKGLTGAEFANVLMEEIGIQLDIAATQAFPALTRLSDTFQNFGESMSEFAARLANDAKIVPLALSAVGLSMKTLPETGSAATQAMYDNQTAAEAVLEKAKTAANSSATKSVTYGRTGQGVDGEMGITSSNTNYDPKLMEAVTQAEEKLNATRKLISDSNVGLTTNNLEAVQKLIKAGGGLEQFLSKSEFYAQNLLTESERLVPVQAAVTKEMTRLGFESVTTREAFVSLVGSLDLTSETGVVTYSALMNVAEGFSAVAPALIAVLSAEELRKAKLLQQIEILNLQGKASEAHSLSVTEEISLLDSRLRVDALIIKQLQEQAKLTSQNIAILEAHGFVQEALNIRRKLELDALLDILKPGQLRLNQLQDEAKLSSQNIAILEASGSTQLALVARRELELVATLDLLKPGQLRLNQLQDEAKTLTLSLALLNAEGNTLTALNITREKEIKTLSVLDRAIQRSINYTADQAKTNLLNNELLIAQERKKEALFASRTLEAKSLSVDDLAIKNRIWALADAKTATEEATSAIEKQSATNKKATDLALTLLTNSIEAKKSEMQALIDLNEPIIGVLKSLFDTLKSSVRELYSTVDSTIKMTTISANALIDSYYKSSSIPTSEASSEELSNAVSVAMKATDENNYATLQDANKEKLFLANKLSQLRDTAKTQLTSAEQQVEYAKEQIKSLDKILITAKSQVDVLEGIDKSVMSISDALNNLASVIAAAIENNISANAIASAATSTAASATAYAANPTAKSSYTPVTNSAKKTTVTGNVINAAGGWTGTLAELDKLLRDNIGTTRESFARVYDVLAQQGIGSDIVSKATGLSVEQINRWATDNGWAKFARGGDHSGGMRLVGEEGPELENTGPSRVFNAATTKSMLQPDNTELIQEIRMLRLEVQSLKAISQTASNYNKTTSSQLTRWDVDGMPPTR